jgi:hypothetical protein
LDSKARLDGTAFALACVLVLILAVHTFGLVQAWFAPVCQTVWDLDGWCLPIGFEGPFADFWSNRSLFSARVSGTIHFVIAALTLGAAVYFLVKRLPNVRRMVLCLVLVDVMAILFTVVVLNDHS